MFPILSFFLMLYFLIGFVFGVVLRRLMIYFNGHNINAAWLYKTLLAWPITLPITIAFTIYHVVKIYKERQMANGILYINKDEEVRFLTNFSHHAIIVDGKTYATSEHYFQAAKFFETDLNWAKKVRTAKHPSDAFRLGKDKAHPIHPKWDKGEAIKHMRIALMAKLEQHDVVRKQLLDTGKMKIVERADWDAVWGDGPKRNGKNQLGRLWMSIRKELTIK